ncbi:hypothetical protein [Streptomyces antibioticus]|uniref:hypothetical protein n=1 Tax=Streptomyces antibioticus TaxID=1890 RepID=UPI0033B3B754
MVEIVLTRPVTHRELRRVRYGGIALAANADGTRLMAVQPARRADAALHVLRRRLDARLPVDVPSTHYPDRDGRVLLNVALGAEAEHVLSTAAAAAGKPAEEVLGRCITAALARQELERSRHLQERLDGLLAHHSPEDVLVCVAGRLRRGTPQAP